MSGSPIKFGTDGWRAIIADEFTFANVRVCAQATARYFHEATAASREIVVGYDTRFASEEFAAAVVEVLAANGVPVQLCDRAAPTPVIGFNIRRLNAGGGVVITSSHNPALYSGFKVRTEQASAAPPEVLSQIEALIPEALDGAVERMPLEEATAKGLVQKFDPRADYLRHLGQLVEIERLRQAGLRVVVDPMHGAGAGYLRELLSGGRTEVIEIRSERNPAFPGMHNPEPIARNLEATREAIVQAHAEAALATDGDADRIGVMDDRGEFVDQLRVFALLTYYLLEVRGLRGPIVKSVTTTSMVHRLGELYGVPVYETGVGFKYLGPKMIETDALIAGEESGGFAFRGHLPERDGILSGLYILDLMARRGKSLPELLEEVFAKVGPHYYDRVDITMTPAERDRIAGLLTTLEPSKIDGLRVTGYDRTDGLRFLLEGGAWALIRLSGTEPLMRIYTEVREGEQVQPLLEAVRELTGA
ncbi:MAG: phosphoglucomutase/phosphomannomutase family protein [Chloroflexi bacterium]|nr:MAG: phosphoglucomutase/phosphomannomutase family protein [Chloroflexota bacterium]